MTKQTLFIGFMLFALFFGAGNLIYPPTLGIEAGTSYWLAMTGFILTGVGLPILAIVAIGLVSNKTTELGNQIHPVFGLTFTSIIYLAIGPFFGIPRAANVAFEMGVSSFFIATPLRSSYILAGFTLLFFLLTFWLSIHPSKLVDRIGQWLTPVLVLAIAALSIGAFIFIDSDIQSPSQKYQSHPFFTGFIEGYLTMDAIAALAFGIIVVSAFRNHGETNRIELVISTMKAGLVAGIALTAVYGSIGWIGAKMATAGSFDNGGQILATAAEIVFGGFGKVILGVIVALACLTTSIGLTVACGQFFSKKTRLSYLQIISIVTCVSFLIANLGLNQIIAISVPVLTTIYPIAIVLILLTFISATSSVYKYGVLFTAVISIFEGLQTFGVTLSSIDYAIQLLPLSSLGLAWLIPAIVGVTLGWIIDQR